MDIDELIKIINNDSSKEAEYYLFEYLLNKDLSKDEEKYILSKLGIKKKIVFKMAMRYFSALGCRKSYNLAMDKEMMIKCLYDDFWTSYNSFLDKVNKLGKELNCDNSLDLSVLFYILLETGNFSINEKHVYDTDNKLNIQGHYYLDIFHGHGVCINYSDMLRDLLNKAGYQSLNMLCYSDEYNSLVSSANHSVNLIVDQDKPYIFDTTNFAIYGCCNNKKAILIEGEGTHHLVLYPYLSGLLFSQKDKTLSLVKDFCLRKDYSSLYNSKNFIDSIVKCKGSIDGNYSLIRDFHQDIMPDIIDITSKTKVKKKKTKLK